MSEFLNIQEVLNLLSLKEDMIAAEFGCGAAHFTMALAKKLSKGSVYALDIQQEKLSALKGRISMEKVSNISTILCDLEEPKGSTLKDNSLDIVLIPNVLFQAENKYAIIKEAKRILKPKGQLVVIDWHKQNKFGPKNVVELEEVKKMAHSLELSLKEEFMSGDYHYVLLFIK